MFKRKAHSNGVVTYHSDLLGVPHAFTTRLGGISQPPYDALNLGTLTKGQGDANTSIAENFRRLRHAMHWTRHVRIQVRQVHGQTVWRPPASPTRLNDSPRADAMVTDHPQHLLTVRTADCVPVLLGTSDGQRVAAIHAGWRGIVAGVVGQTLDAMGTQDVFVAVGPCIGVEHFEVGPEVLGAFAQAGLGDAAKGTHINLTHAVVRQLQRAGVAHNRIDVSDLCTYQGENEFFSHRRDVTHHGLPATGRMAGAIATAAA